MAPAALLMVAGLDEDTVDFVPNYDDQLLQPGVLPAAYPNLLVNGAQRHRGRHGHQHGPAQPRRGHRRGPAPHRQPRLLARRPDEVRARPRPALRRQDRRARRHPRRLPHRPRHASAPGRPRGSRSVTPRRKGIVVTELPYLVGPEKVIEKIKDLVQAKKLQGISDVKDLTDRKHGLRLVIEIKNGFNPDAVLEQLYKLTPMEDSFGINNVALVDGQPRTLGLKDLLRGLRRLPHRRRAPPHRVPPAQARGAAAPRRGPAHRDPRHRRGHPGDPHLRRRRRWPRPG